MELPLLAWRSFLVRTSGVFGSSLSFLYLVQGRRVFSGIERKMVVVGGTVFFYNGGVGQGNDSLRNSNRTPDVAGWETESGAEATDGFGLLEMTVGPSTYVLLCTCQKWKDFASCSTVEENGRIVAASFKKKKAPFPCGESCICRAGPAP
ncbi:hypothetical protein B0T16DRAFT_216668 [Cercophora newfieldiana]|uniref:Uncharacterized protein n=1 Tax=Cercophora newfieldiana TaxID=92897 RepID=A0AA39XWH7_9PEZI|nr:hypothetical protein B0T16DRAFT_216668 [Cercophora newfieldiana]